MKNIILFFAAIAISHHVFSQLPQLKWWFDIDDSSFGQSVAADIDNDGKLELIFGCYRNDSMVYALNAEDGSLLVRLDEGGLERIVAGDVNVRYS